ncbi:hypothetical protein [Methylobacterium brachiatum]|uniref:hypothetical protein n=1 Tax=Methylobacterium brachiatum TaxID=269660 RepID=UPI0008E2097B|nr:hypothetical protein [Methylobacterium brachiatum]SFI85586.1 hypothetical protein SAMN02799642_02925 [Methylobacterium brachiatum]
MSDEKSGEPKNEGALRKTTADADFSQQIGKGFSAESSHTTTRTSEIDATPTEAPSSGHTSVRSSVVDASTDPVIERAKRKNDSPDDAAKDGQA